MKMFTKTKYRLTNAHPDVTEELSTTFLELIRRKYNNQPVAIEDLALELQLNPKAINECARMLIDDGRLLLIRPGHMNRAGIYAVAIHPKPFPSPTLQEAWPTIKDYALRHSPFRIVEAAAALRINSFALYQFLAAAIEQDQLTRSGAWYRWAGVKKHFAATPQTETIVAEPPIVEEPTNEPQTPTGPHPEPLVSAQELLKIEVMAMRMAWETENQSASAREFVQWLKDTNVTS